MDIPGSFAGSEKVLDRLFGTFRFSRPIFGSLSAISTAIATKELITPVGSNRIAILREQLPPR